MYFAKLAEQAERYDEIAEHTRDVGNVVPHYLWQNETCCELPPGMLLGLAVRLGKSSPE